MNPIKSLRSFAKIYLWIFLLKVLHVCGEVEYRKDMNPYSYQIFDDENTDDLLNELNAVATPLWRIMNKHHLYYSRLPRKSKNGNSLTPREITFENSNSNLNFNNNKIKNTIWPKLQEYQQHHLRSNGKNDNDNKQRRHGLQQLLVVRSSLGDVDGDGGDGGIDKEGTLMTNIRYKQNGILPVPIIMEKHFETKATRAVKKSKTLLNDANKIINEDINEDDDVKENLFPLKDDNTLSINDVNDGPSHENDDRVGVAVFADEENGIANSNGNENESLNYSDNNEANNNYLMSQSTHTYHSRDSHDKRKYSCRQIRKIINKTYDKRAKPTIGRTPFLPAVSGGAMTNLGKFFRDLSKNVHVNEQYQWDAEQQKLLEGDPNFVDIKHHLTKPNAATDQQTAEWIKAIRFYRPSQKIRSLVAMNPHGQWAHSSQFIDPNYMWVGLGK